MFEGFGISLLPNVSAGNIITWALVLVAVWWVRGMPAMRKAKNDGDASLRGDLLERIKALEATQIRDRDQHSEERRLDRKACDEVTEELRQSIREQDKLIDALQRQLIMYQVAAARALPLGSNSPAIEKMLGNLEDLFPLRDKGKSETLQSAEDTCHAAEVTVEQVKQDEAKK